MLTAPVLILKVSSATSSSCRVERSIYSPDQIFSFFLSATVACNGIREETNPLLLSLDFDTLPGDDSGSDPSALFVKVPNNSLGCGTSVSSGFP